MAEEPGPGLIKGLYEAHVQVGDLERAIEFYERLGLETTWKKAPIAFLRIEQGRSWLGLWERPAGDHVAARHLAFRIEFAELADSLTWLRAHGIEPEADGEFEPNEPTVRPDQANASVYFSDPDGNLLELICEVPAEVPSNLPRMYLSEWERLRHGGREGQRSDSCKLEGIDHVALNAGDQARSIEWYQDVLGLERRYQEAWGDEPAVLCAGETCIALFSEPKPQAPASPQPDPVGLRHIAFRVDRRNFERAQTELRGRAIAFDFSDHGIAHSIYFADPDEHEIELTTYEV